MIDHKQIISIEKGTVLYGIRYVSFQTAIEKRIEPVKCFDGVFKAEVVETKNVKKNGGLVFKFKVKHGDRFIWIEIFRLNENDEFRERTCFLYSDPFYPTYDWKFYLEPGPAETELKRKKNMYKSGVQNYIKYLTELEKIL